MAHNIDGSGNLASFPDIHKVIDGKLTNHNIRTRFSNIDKQRLIESLISLINDRANPSIKQYGISGLRLIQKDVGSAPNWQGCDGLFADDVLADICEMISIIKDSDIINTAINHIAEQMSDMIKTNGTCPTGRLRVMQIYVFLKDYLQTKH